MRCHIFLGTFTKPPIQQCHCFGLRGSAVNPHYLWQFSKGQLNKDRLIEVELVDKDGQTEKEKMFYKKFLPWHATNTGIFSTYLTPDAVRLRLVVETIDISWHSSSALVEYRKAPGCSSKTNAMEKRPQLYIICVIAMRMWRWGAASSRGILTANGRHSVHIQTMGRKLSKAFTKIL